jgi:hypothetical protein
MQALLSPLSCVLFNFEKGLRISAQTPGPCGVTHFQPPRLQHQKQDWGDQQAEVGVLGVVVDSVISEETSRPNTNTMSSATTGRDLRVHDRNQVYRIFLPAWLILTMFLALLLLVSRPFTGGNNRKFSSSGSRANARFFEALV